MRQVVLAVSVWVGLAGAARADQRLVRGLPPDLALRSARVLRSLLLFQTARSHEEQADRLAGLRARDRLQLVVEATPQAGGLGAVIMGAMCAAAAHAPRGVRRVFEGPVHLGPAVFDSGGLGAGIGGRFR